MAGSVNKDDISKVYSEDHIARADIPTGQLGIGNKFLSKNGDVHTWLGDGWVQTSFGGAAGVSGLAVNAVVQGAGTYNTTDVIGYRVLVQGSANWSVTPKDGTAQTIPQAAMIVGDVYPEHLTAITVGTGGSVLLYIPA